MAGPRQAWLLLLGVACATTAVPCAAQLQRSGEYLARMDGDGDGGVSLREYQDWLSYAFDAMDRNRDGVLVASELPGGRGEPLTRATHRQRLAVAFGRQDGNGDGLLDARELAAPPR